MKKSTILLVLGLTLTALLASCSDMVGDLKGKDKTEAAPERTVTFDSGEAEIPAAPGSITLKASENTVGTLPAPPVRPGYVFSGWYTAAEAGNRLFTADTWVGSSLTVHAAWSAGETCTVSFNANGGTGPQSVTVAAGSLLAKPADPLREGYRFAGWFTDGTFTTPWNFETGAVNASMILVARWETWTYWVTFASPGAETAASPEYLGVSSPASTLANLPSPPVRRGYLFRGWYTEDNGGGEAFTTATAVASDVTVYAAWDSYAYQVTFSAPDATAAPNPAALTVASPAVNVGSLPAEPAREGYTFAGWWTEDNAHGAQFTATTEVTGNLTLYAAWSLVPVYQVSFNSAGGSAVGAQSIASGGLVSEPSAPTKAGYAFGGWFVDQSLNIPWNFATGTVTANLELHAKWVSHSYSVTFSSQNATTGPSPAAMTVASPATTLSAFPAAPARTGYTFAGWWTGTGGTGTEITLSTPITANVTFYPKWVSYSYTVTFNGMEATTVPSPATRTVASPATTVGTLPTNPARTGYIFGGWYTGPAGTGSAFTASSTVSGNMTVYAKWNTYSYTVSFSNQNATTGPSPATMTVASPATTLSAFPAAPARTGYTFAGWWTGSGGTGTQVSLSTPITGNVTYYPKWTITVTFSAPEATTGPSPTVMTRANGSTTLGTLPAAPTRTGYTFGGWYTGQNGTGTAFTGTTTITQSITVYAKWSYDMSSPHWYSYTVTNGTVSLGKGANWPLDVTSVTIPSNINGSPVTSLRDDAFSNTPALTTVTLPASVTVLGQRAFQGCTALSSVTMPNAMTTINGYAFAQCTALSVITLPTSLKGIGDYAFSGCSGLRNIVIPVSVTSIGIYAFQTCFGLRTVSIPGTTVIGEGAFQECFGLRTVGLSNSIPSIGSKAFYNCTGITSINIPNSVTTINDSTFGWCTQLQSVTIPSTITSIGNQAFIQCGALTSITIPTTVTTIGSAAFWGCSSLTSIVIPNSVTSLGQSVFTNCSKITSITLPSALTSIPNYAFNNCSALTSISIPATVTFIGDGVFQSCFKLSSVTIPGSVPTIGNNTFLSCNELTSITIPSSVTSIGLNAFSHCSKLTTITMMRTTPPSLNTNALYGLSATARIRVPSASLTAYRTATNWSAYASRMVGY